MMFRLARFLASFSPRGTDKLKELGRQPVVVERVEQLLADSDPRVRQVQAFFGNSSIPFSFYLFLFYFILFF